MIANCELRIANGKLMILNNEKDKFSFLCDKEVTSE